jgi:arylsulfatase A-like enzyme
MDQTLGYLVKRLNEANLLDKMNIVVVSDHGEFNFLCDIFM